MKVLNMSEVRIVALAAATAWFSFAHHLKVNIVIVAKVRNVALAAVFEIVRFLLINGRRFDVSDDPRGVKNIIKLMFFNYR